jgi:hypothetical protein
MVGLSPFTFTEKDTPPRTHEVKEYHSPLSRKLVEVERRRNRTDEILQSDMDTQMLKPKLGLFAFLLDVEILCDTSDVFTRTWTGEYKALFETLYAQGNPI